MTDRTLSMMQVEDWRTPAELQQAAYWHEQRKRLIEMQRYYAQGQASTPNAADCSGTVQSLDRPFGGLLGGYFRPWR